MPFGCGERRWAYPVGRKLAEPVQIELGDQPWETRLHIDKIILIIVYAHSKYIEAVCTPRSGPFSQILSQIGPPDG